MKRALRLAAGVVALLAACAEERLPEDAPPTWKTDVGPILVEACTRCHSGPEAAAGYAVDHYLAAIGRSAEGPPRLIAKDRSSRFLVRLRERDHLVYLGVSEALQASRLALLESWVDAGIPYAWSVAHLPGILNPDDDEFHGLMVAGEGWSMKSCRTCHGAEYEGGGAGVSCRTCHRDTPEACGTCHGPPPGLRRGKGSGAHARHLSRSSTLTVSVECRDCHVVPARFDAEAHADGVVQVVFGERARARGATPIWDPDRRTCSGVACHGAGLHGGSVAAPAWDRDRLGGRCDACHGAPPARTATIERKGPSTRCELCHPSAGPNLTIADPALHVNGTLNVSEAAQACNICHAGPPDPIPFFDSDKEMRPDRMSVGAHERHLTGGFFARGFDCSACHVVPESVSATSHPSGRPAEIVFSGAAIGGGVAARWDREQRTCFVWCHGAGFSGGPQASPRWNEQGALILCGSCHEIPPPQLSSGAVHPADCGRCHGEVIGSDLRWIDHSKHINGRVEVTGP